jgi:hypothetical protein
MATTRLLPRLHVLATRRARADVEVYPPKTEGAGNAGCAARTHSLACEVWKAHEQITTGTSRTDIPCAMVLTAYSALSPVTGLSCHRHRTNTSAQLDTSVGVSGPHALAVRVGIVRRTLPPASTASRPTSVTTRTPLLSRRDAAKSAADLGVTAMPADCDRLARRAICAWQACTGRSRFGCSAGAISAFARASTRPRGVERLESFVRRA